MVGRLMNSTAACVLGLLDIGPPPPDRTRWEADGSMSGAEVWAAVQNSVGGFWSMTRSQVYQELRRVTATGLAEEIEPGRYKITAAGKKAVAEWFREFALAEPRDDQLRSPLGLTVFFGHYLPAEVLARVVREHRLRLQRRLDQLDRIEAALVDDVSFPGAMLRRGILNATALQEWTDEVLARIDAMPRPRRHPKQRRR